MADSIKSIDSLVKQIVNRLDCRDNPENKADGIIKKDEWDKFAAGKGRTVQIGISVFRAKKSVEQYLKQQANTEKEKMDLAQKWLDKLITDEEEIVPVRLAPINKEDKSKIEADIKQAGTVKNDATLVSVVHEDEEIINKNPDATIENFRKRHDIRIDYKESAKRLQSKWCGIWTQAKLPLSFFEKLLDIIPKLNLKVDKFDSENYASPQEQIADRLCLLFAQEAGLNPKSKTSNYAGLFQLANDTIYHVKQSAQKEEISRLMTDKKDFDGLSGFAKLSGEQQLDWLIAFCDCKGILESPKTVDELAAKIKSISIINAKKHGCKTKTERAAQILNIYMKNNKVPEGTKYIP